MPDIINARAEPRTEPRPHAVIDAIIAAGRAAAELRNRHHAEGRPLRRQLAASRAEAAPSQGGA